MRSCVSERRNYSWSEFFKNLGIHCRILENKSGMMLLTIEGIKAVVPLISLFKEDLSLGYWKSGNILLFIEFLKYQSLGVQSFKAGLITLLDILYKYPNERQKTYEE